MAGKISKPKKPRGAAKKAPKVKRPKIRTAVR
jgi:hypothetical protein